MQSPVENRIAADNAADRALQRRDEANKPKRNPAANRALCGERCADHGEDSGREFRTGIAEELTDLGSQSDAAYLSPSFTGPQATLIVGTLVAKNVERMLAKCDEHSSATDQFAINLERGIEDALLPKRPEWYALGAEYRAVMRGMDSDQRADFIERMSATRNEPVLRFAIASVPPELSGTSPGTYRAMYDSTLALKDPTLLTRPADLQKRRAALEVVRDGIRRTALELSDPASVAALRALVDGGNVS